LIFLAKGDLPWSLKKNYTTADIIKAKSCTRIVDMLLSDLPGTTTILILIILGQFRQSFEYVKNLGFEEEPEYEYL